MFGDLPPYHPSEVPIGEMIYPMCQDCGKRSSIHVANDGYQISKLNEDGKPKDEWARFFGTFGSSGYYLCDPCLKSFVKRL